MLTMLRSVGWFFLFFSLSCFGAAPNVAFFYGANPPWDELRAYDVVVVEPEHGIDPKTVSTPATQVFAYLSVGEVEYDRPYAPNIPQGAIAGANAPWRAHVIDQTHPEWPQFFIERIVAPLWDAGYRGFFLDTLDSFQLISKTDEDRARQVQGLAGVIRALRAKYPEAKLIFNRGFEILPELHRDVYAVAVESIYRGWDQRQGQYVEVPESDRKWLMAHLTRASEEYKLPVIAIEYAPPGRADLARETARKVAQLGFVPWVANPELNQIGVGNIEVMPRRILMVYQGTGDPYDLMDHRVHRLATMPLNHLGYVVEYVDITSQPLPTAPLAGRYAGVVTWFDAGQVTVNPALRQWLARQRQQGIRIAMLGAFPFSLADPVAKTFGLNSRVLPRVPDRVTIAERHGIIGFEAQPVADRRAFVPLQAVNSAPLLRLTSEAGDTMDAAAITTWGGFALAPFDYLVLPLGQGDRWIVHPIEFFRSALALPHMPVPDVTTENGRRLMLVHIDGDGFMNRAEFRGTPYAGEILLKDILERYRIPTTVSVIQGEIAANGLYPNDSAALEAIARRIFALPHVEIASHTYSHPFRWAEVAAADAEAYHLQIPGYKFNLEAEIDGSVRYIDKQLAPPGKRTRMMLWTGDTNPGPQALERTHALGILNMNGGDTTITRAHPTLTRVAPLGLHKGSHFQVYAPNQNENVYTNNWTGPFYGYERVIETFQLTDYPYRLKPINIYYHSYSATRRASMSALERVYAWALAQPVMNIYASEYAQKVNDSNRTVIARGPGGWVVRTGEALRQVRVPAALGMPDLAASSGVAGFVTRGSERYVHLAGGEAVIRFAQKQPTEPYVVDANGRIERFERSGRSAQFTLRAHVPLRFSLANVAGCRVEGDGRRLAGATAGGVTRYQLKQNAIDRLSITCA